MGAPFMWILKKKYDYWWKKYGLEKTETSLYDRNWATSLKPRWRSRPLRLVWWALIIIYPHIKFWWYWTMLNFCGIVVAILKMATSRNFSMSGINSTSLSTHISNFDDIGQCWIFNAHILYRVLAAILKMADIFKILKTQICSSNGDLSLCQILCLYHYTFRSYHKAENFRTN